MAGANQTHIITDMIDIRPGEIIQEAYVRHIHEIKHSLIDSLMQHDPSFFEQLIVDLLIAMNYGYDKSSGVVVGGALAYAESQQQKSLKLIDGEKLAELMVQYEIGIQKTARPIYLYKLDSDYLG